MSNDRMTAEPEGNRLAGRQGPAQPPVPSAESNARGLMTPWLRRRFGLDLEPGKRVGVGQGRPTAIALGQIRRLLARVRNTEKRARAWKPDIGSLRPELVQRFSSSVAQRHAGLDLVTVRRDPAVPQDSWQHELELTLPTGAQVADAATGTEPDRLTGPSIFTVGQQIPALRPDALTSGRPSRPSSPPRGPSRPSGQPRERDLPPRSRLFARVEEVTSSGRKGTSERAAQVEPREPAGEAVLPPEEPGPERGMPAVSRGEPAPTPGQPAIQRTTKAPQMPAPSRRRERLPQEGESPDRQTADPPPEREPREPPESPPEEAADLAAPEPDVAEGQLDGELPLGPAPGVPSVTAPQAQMERQPGPPPRSREAPPSHSREAPRPHSREALRRPGRELRSPTGTPPSRADRPSRPLHRPPPDRDEEEGDAAAPARGPSQPEVLAEVEQPEVQQAEPVEGPQPADSEVEPLAPVAGRARSESTEDMVLRKPAAGPVSQAQPSDAPRPVDGETAPAGESVGQRQVQESTEELTAPFLTEDGRRILVRAGSRARSTLTRLRLARHQLPGAGTAGRARPTTPRAPVIGPGIPGPIRRRPRLGGSPALYGRGPVVRIGPDSSLPVIRRIPAGARRDLERTGERTTLPAPLEGGERMASERGLPLRPSSVPSAAAPRETSIQRSMAAGGRFSAGTGLPGLPPPPPDEPSLPGLPPPEEPSLPLARRPEPKPAGPQAVEQASTPSGVLQREPEGPVGMLQAEPISVQRVGEDDEIGDEIDLGELARRVYPEIKRLLSIERERAHGRPA